MNDNKSNKSNKGKLNTIDDEPVMIGSVCLDQLVQPVDFSGAATAGTPTRIQIAKPRRDEWVTVRTGDKWRLAIYVIEDTESMDREIYIVTNDLANGELADDARYTILHFAASSTGRLFWWYIKMGTEHRRNHWAESALKAVEIAQGKWIRVIAAREGYEIREAKAQMPEPQWPDMSQEDAIKLAFKDRVIDTMDHPIAKRLTLGG
jgi:hypothetical protein